MISGYVSIKSVISKIYRDLGVNTELDFQSCIEWISEALLFIGSFDQFKLVSKELEIEDFKVKLPCDFYKLAEISYNSLPLYYSGNSLSSNYFCDDCQISCKNSLFNGEVPFETFYINDYYIYTSFEEGDICMVYLAFPVDDDGYPMIPDDVYFAKACTAYVTKMLDYQEWRKGRIPDKVFQKSEDDWNFYVNSARGSANMPNLQQLENLKNIMVRSIPKQNEFNHFFNGTTKQEQKYIQ